MRVTSSIVTTMIDAIQRHKEVVGCCFNSFLCYRHLFGRKVKELKRMFARERFIFSSLLEAIMKTVMVTLIMGLVFGCMACPVFSSEDDFEHGRRIDDGVHGPAVYRSKIYGTVEKLPETGLFGIWIVNGREFVVTERTRLEQKHGLFEPGAYVEIKGMKSENTFTAEKIEVKRAKAEASHVATEQKITGKVEKIPKGTLGTWVIGGSEVLVLKHTVLQEKNGKATLGSLVEVVGMKSGETFQAGRIETQQAIQ
jgi:hypothetical protein